MTPPLRCCVPLKYHMHLHCLAKGVSFGSHFPLSSLSEEISMANLFLSRGPPAQNKKSTFDPKRPFNSFESEGKSSVMARDRQISSASKNPLSMPILVEEETNGSPSLESLKTFQEDTDMNEFLIIRECLGQNL